MTATEHDYELAPVIDDIPEAHNYTPTSNGDTPRAATPWLIDAAELLAEPDPGPTPWLIQDLIVAGAIIAAVGRWKTTKSYGLLDLCISVATGEPAFGRLEIPQPGPVVFVNEESGRAALWRRLDALCRGRAINPERLRGQLLLGANARVKLDATEWQTELLDLSRQHEPRLFVFDPLARMKAPGREENAQNDMAVLIEFVRALRDETGAAVCFVHHTGHGGDHMRGSSDLESVWETRLAWKRDGQSPLVTIESEHREAEAAPTIEYRISWDTTTRTMRLELQDDEPLAPLQDRLIEHLQTTPGTTAEIAKAVGIRRSDVARTLTDLETAGTLRRVPSERRDATGRLTRPKVWEPTKQQELNTETRRPDPRTPQGPTGANRHAPSQGPTSIGGTRTDAASHPPQNPDDDIPF